LNIGTSVYLEGKYDRVPVGINIPAVGNIAVNSPRVGLIKLGEGYSRTLAQSYYTNPEVFGSDPINNLDSEGNKIDRLSTLFHEARHSDGSGKHLGFVHANCPAGHDLAGLPACDDSNNGPYAVGAMALKVLYIQCSTCSTLEKTRLKVSILDSFSRLLNRNNENDSSTYWETTPEGRR
jgi:hypothetical protein